MSDDMKNFKAEVRRAAESLAAEFDALASRDSRSDWLAGLAETLAPILDAARNDVEFPIIRLDHCDHCAHVAKDLGLDLDKGVKSGVQSLPVIRVVIEQPHAGTQHVRRVLDILFDSLKIDAVQSSSSVSVGTADTDQPTEEELPTVADILPLLTTEAIAAVFDEAARWLEARRDHQWDGQPRRVYGFKRAADELRRHAEALRGITS